MRSHTPSKPVRRAVLCTLDVTIRGTHGVTRPTKRNLWRSKSIRSQNECAVPTQEFSGAHSPFSFKLHFGERKCAFASGNDQVFVAAQNFSGLAIEVDNRRGKDFQISTIDFHERAWPRIVSANFSLNRFG